MKDQLRSYIDLLFAGASGAEEVKQEILQNTLDRYDDLVSQGKTPEAAYSLAISGIGDISEILYDHASVSPQVPITTTAPEEDEATANKRKLLRAIAIALYIMCPIPLFLLGNELGLCILLAFVAVATVLIILQHPKETEDEDREKKEKKPETPQQALKESISSIIWAIGLATYFIISFATQAWFITWVIFPIIGAVQGLARACMDLKEEKKNEA